MEGNPFFAGSRTLAKARLVQCKWIPLILSHSIYHLLPFFSLFLFLSFYFSLKRLPGPRGEGENQGSFGSLLFYLQTSALDLSATSYSFFTLSYVSHSLILFSSSPCFSPFLSLFLPLTLPLAFFITASLSPLSLCLSPSAFLSLSLSLSVFLHQPLPLTLSPNFAFLPLLSKNRSWRERETIYRRFRFRGRFSASFFNSSRSRHVKCFQSP